MRIFHWIGSVATIAILLICFQESILAQSATSRTITISATPPQSVSQSISGIFDGQAPTPLSLQVTVERGGWWFIRLESFPDSVKLLGELPGTAAGGEIRPGQWYPFNRPVTLTVLVEPTATSPINLRYWLGRVPEGQRQPATSDQAQKVVQQHNIKIEGKEEFVKLFWQTERPIITVDPATMRFLVYENTYFEPTELTIEGDTAGWSFIRLRGVPDHLKVRLAGGSPSDAVTLEPGSELVNEQWYGFKQILKLEVSLKEMISSAREVRLAIESGEAELPNDTRSAAITAINRNGIVPHGTAVVVPISLEPSSWTGIFKTFSESPVWRIIFGGGLILLFGALIRTGFRYYRARQKQPAASPDQEIEDAKPSAEPALPDSTTGSERKKGWRWGIPKALQLAWARGEAADERPPSGLVNLIRGLTPATGQPPFTPPTQSPDLSPHVAQSVQSHTKQLREIEHKLTALEGLVLSTYQVKDRLAEIEQMLEGRRLPPSNRDRDEQVAVKMKELADELRADVNKQSQLLSAQIEGLEQALSQLFNKLREQQAHSDETRRLLEDHSQQVREMASAPSRSAGLLADATAPTGTPDRLYARLLGLIFAGNIDGLRRESLDATVQQAGEILNRFFQEELPLAHQIQDLDAQMKDIVARLEEIVSKGSAVNRETYGDLRLAAERARRLSREISSIQTQLQNRELELDLQVRISTSPGGHAIFLEELGRAVKQAIDKFADPQAYIERRLDSLVTQEVVGVADLCDRDVAPPGENDEWEHLLKALFQAAKLKPIQPIPMEPFQSVEHNIVELVSGGRSQAIARVIRRGFYYKDQVLRKADVAVYK